MRPDRMSMDSVPVKLKIENLCLAGFIDQTNGYCPVAPQALVFADAYLEGSVSILRNRLLLSNVAY